MQHSERHFTAGERLRDIVIGMSDGLTVPFALAAGLTGVVASASLILTAGLAEIVAGSIAMGLGGYLASRGESDHYHSELARERSEVLTRPADEMREVAEVLQRYGVSPDESRSVVESLRRRPEQWVAFMMRYELGLEQPALGRAWQSALTIAGAYALGGLVPLSAYLVCATPSEALKLSAAVTLVALAVFGGVKARMTGVAVLRGALQTAAVGGLAAAAAFLMARTIS